MNHEHMHAKIGLVGEILLADTAESFSSVTLSVVLKMAVVLVTSTTDAADVRSFLVQYEKLLSKQVPRT